MVSMVDPVSYCVHWCHTRMVTREIGPETSITSAVPEDKTLCGTPTKQLFHLHQTFPNISFTDLETCMDCVSAWTKEPSAQDQG